MKRIFSEPVSLFTHLYLRIALVGLLVCLAWMAGALVLESRAHRQDREAEAEKNARLIAKLCQDAFFRNDWDRIEKTLRDVGQANTEMIGGRIRDMTGAVVADWSPPGAAKIPPRPPPGAADASRTDRMTVDGTRALLAARPIVSPESGRKLGTLELLFTEEAFGSAQRNRFLGSAAVFLAITALMLLVTRYGVNRALAPTRRMIERIREASHAGGSFSADPTGIAELDDLGRTFEEAFQALRNAQEKLEESARTRAMSEMAFGVAHDFNNFLAAIVANREGIERMLREDPPPMNRIREALASVDFAARNAETLIRKIFLLGRAPGAAEQPVLIRADALIAEAVAILEAKWKASSIRRGVRYAFRIAAEPVELRGIEGDLRSALVNMIGNALDAMPDGGTVSAGADRDGDNVVFFVEDEGSGVPEAIRDKIFEPFFTTKAPHGTGLGLAVVRKIAAAHGGSAGCLPRPDGRPGTRFFVSIPLEPPASVPAPAQEAAPRGEPVRHDVLLVDDDPLVLEAMEEILRHLGHSVTSCRSGPEALEALGKGSYSVVLSDIGMSPMNGFEVARRVRAASPDTRIVLMSGWSMEDREQEAYGFVDRFLQKPFRRKDVAEVLGGPAPPGRFRSAPDAGP